MNNDVIELVIENERTCRLYVDMLIQRGVRVNVDPDRLTHLELQKLVWAIIAEIENRQVLH